jgi:hypothetical protein
MACYLLHVVEQPDEDPYADQDVKDVVGQMPRFYCACFDPIERLVPSAATRCLARETPCWNPDWADCAQRRR